jgi:lipopolysaccharide/colanic/teichoic acid biosynthesis glycosyltransferase
VLRGELSLVGPRPVLFGPGGPPDHIGLTAVKPGLTGRWRLSGPGASLADQAAQDLRYVHEYSIWEDLRILWVSARRVPRGGATPGPLSRWDVPAGDAAKPAA